MSDMTNQSEQRQNKLQKAKRWVFKFGSSLLTNDGQGLDVQAINHWVDQMAALKMQGNDVILVSSGAVASGMSTLGWDVRPNAIHDLQAAAAVGQMGLVKTYDSSFARYDIHTAQILLTHDDLSDRKRYLNARSTMQVLLDLNVIPVVNENDSVVTDEIRFGDNDTLGALVANLLEADVLVLLTDQQGLFDEDPRNNPDAKLIPYADVADQSLDSKATGAGALGSGGMATKLRAARLAARSGAMTVIAAGKETDILSRIASGEEVGTVFLPKGEALEERKRWLAGHLQLRGTLTLTAEGVEMLQGAGAGVLAEHVCVASGTFVRGDMVACVDENGREIARGLVNYHIHEVSRLLGKPKEQFESVIGYIDEAEMISAQNRVML